MKSQSKRILPEHPLPNGRGCLRLGSTWCIAAIALMMVFVMVLALLKAYSLGPFSGQRSHYESAGLLIEAPSTRSKRVTTPVSIHVSTASEPRNLIVGPKHVTHARNKSDDSSKVPTAVREISAQISLIRKLEHEPVSLAIIELSAMLEHQHPEVRHAAVEAVGDLSAISAIAPLVGALSDSNSSVRVAAIEGLVQYKQPIVVPAIESLLSDPEQDVRLAAMDALTELASPSTPHLLAGLLFDQDTIIRKSAVSLLGDIGGVQALEYLNHSLYDPDPGVRAMAKRVISELREQVLN